MSRPTCALPSAAAAKKNATQPTPVVMAQPGYTEEPGRINWARKHGLVWCRWAVQVSPPILTTCVCITLPTGMKNPTMLLMPTWRLNLCPLAWISLRKKLFLRRRTSCSSPRFWEMTGSEKRLIAANCRSRLRRDLHCVLTKLLRLFKRSLPRLAHYTRVSTPAAAPPHCFLGLDIFRDREVR